MKFRPASVLLVLLHATTLLAAAHDSATNAYPEPPILEQSQPALPNVPEWGRPAFDPPPPAVQEPALFTPVEKRYRSTIKALSAHRHWYVRIKLKNGKVFTGLLRRVGVVSFTLYTDALGGPSFDYDQLAEMPLPVPAVGTRIKQGAEWTGLVLLAVAAVPILIPLILTGVVSDC